LTLTFYLANMTPDACDAPQAGSDEPMKVIPRRGPKGIRVVLLLAFGLQTWHAGQQSLWYDEGFSVYLASRSLSEITSRTAADIHPPLYYYLLHFWQAGAGTTEFSLRFLSAMFAVLCVVLAYALGTRLHGRGTGELAALLVAVSPLYLWYGRDARMYTLVTALGLASSYFLLRVLAGDRRLFVWLGYVLTGAAAIYAHFYALFLIVFHVFFTLVRVWRGPSTNRRDLWLRAGSAEGLALLTFAPWSGFAWTRLGSDVSYWPGTLPLDQVLRDTLRAFATGHTVAPPLANPIAVLYLVLFVAALLLTSLGGQRDRAGFLPFILLYLLTPVVLLYAISYGRPKWHPRYLMLASPPFLIGIAAGVVDLWSRPSRREMHLRVQKGWAIAATLFLLATAAYADMNLYRDPRFTKDDWRSVATYVARHKQADEVVLLVSGHAFPVFTYYYPGDDWVPLPNEPTLSTRNVLDFRVADDLNRALAGKRGVWLVLWEDDVVDPNGIVPMMLAMAGTEETVPRAFWGIGVRHFRFRSAVHFSPEPPVQHVTQVNFASELELLGYRLPDQPPPADQGVDVTLFWKAQRPLTKDYRLALRVVDAEGHLWGKLDRRPADYLFPTDRWLPDRTVPGRYRIPLVAGTPAGTYWLKVGVYAPGDPEGLDVLDSAGAAQGKTARLGPIRLARPSRPSTPDELGLTQRLAAPLGDELVLLGGSLPRSAVVPGDAIPMTLGLQVRQTPHADYRLHVLWGPEPGPSAVSQSFPLGTDDAPVTEWEAGDVVRIQRTVSVPRDAAAGELRVWVSVTGSSGQAIGGPVMVGTVRVQGVEHRFSRPRIDHRQEATFDDGIRLLGYAGVPRAARPGDGVKITLFWQAAAVVDRSYYRFVHLLDRKGKVWSQYNSRPLDGARPTTSWLPGEFLIDTVLVTLPVDLPAGTYRLEIGFFDADTEGMPRLPVRNGEGKRIGDSLILDGRVTVR